MKAEVEGKEFSQNNETKWDLVFGDEITGSQWLLNKQCFHVQFVDVLINK